MAVHNARNAVAVGDTDNQAAIGVNTGIYSNGRIACAGGWGMLTHLPTRDGHRVVTTPLSLHAELHLSGSAQLAGQCNGLAVVERAAGHFVVEELAGGTSDVAFDWMVITRQPDPDGTCALELPEQLPQVLMPDLPDAPDAG